MLLKGINTTIGSDKATGVIVTTKHLITAHRFTQALCMAAYSEDLDVERMSKAKAERILRNSVFCYGRYVSDDLWYPEHDQYWDRCERWVAKHYGI